MPSSRRRYTCPQISLEAITSTAHSICRWRISVKSPSTTARMGSELRADCDPTAAAPPLDAILIGNLVRAIRMTAQYRWFQCRRRRSSCATQTHKSVNRETLVRDLIHRPKLICISLQEAAAGICEFIDGNCPSAPFCISVKACFL